MKQIKSITLSLLMLTTLVTCNGMEHDPKTMPQTLTIKNEALQNCLLLTLAQKHGLSLEQKQSTKSALSEILNLNVPYNQKVVDKYRKLAAEQLHKSDLPQCCKNFIIKIDAKYYSGDNLTDFDWEKYLFG